MADEVQELWAYDVLQTKGLKPEWTTILSAAGRERSPAKWFKNHLNGKWDLAGRENTYWIVKDRKSNVFGYMAASYRHANSLYNIVIMI